MIKIFVTGDNHFGKKYDRYPEAKERLIQSRFDSFRDMVNRADEEGCHLFVVTGDLFDDIHRVRVGDVRQVVDILAAFHGTVLVLPGNHDYYTGEEKVWKDFENALASLAHNIILLKEFQPYTFDVGEERVVVYPAFCQSKHSAGNNLGWIKAADIQKNGVINIGIAHGALHGVTPDINGEYFLMTERELMEIPVDVWLVGHTHIPYPDILREDADTAGYRIFNAGTHEQTDLHNRTDGNGFLVTVEKHGTEATVLARKYVSGKTHFYDAALHLKPDSDTALRDALSAAFADKGQQAVVRVQVTGSIRQLEYVEKEKIYEEILGGFLAYEKSDSELSEEITREKIQSEFAQTSFAAQFMEQLMDDPMELQMAYELLCACREAR